MEEEHAKETTNKHLRAYSHRGCSDTSAGDSERHTLHARAGAGALIATSPIIHHESQLAVGPVQVNAMAMAGNRIYKNCNTLDTMTMTK